MAAQQPRGLRLSYARLHSARATVGITPRPGALPYGFRTPPLYNVTKTGPYSHSGSIAELSDAIRIHIDPLLFVEPKTMDANDRIEYYERLRIWSGSPLNGVVATDSEIEAIADFLGILSYESDFSVKFVD